MSGISSSAYDSDIGDDGDELIRTSSGSGAAFLPGLTLGAIEAYFFLSASAFILVIAGSSIYSLLSSVSSKSESSLSSSSSAIPLASLSFFKK